MNLGIFFVQIKIIGIKKKWKPPKNQYDRLIDELTFYVVIYEILRYLNFSLTSKQTGLTLTKQADVEK